MSSDSNVNEISELLGSLRENAQYLGELGAETVELVADRADESSLVSASVSVVSGPPNYKATATTSPRTNTAPDEFSTIRTRTTPISAAPQDTLFGDLRLPVPSCNQSTETFEVGWLYILVSQRRG